MNTELLSAYSNLLNAVGAVLQYVGSNEFPYISFQSDCMIKIEQLLPHFECGLSSLTTFHREALGTFMMSLEQGKMRRTWYHPIEIYLLF
jgi:hypothetical protein